jgi:hypothetical protein
MTKAQLRAKFPKLKPARITGSEGPGEEFFELEEGYRLCGAKFTVSFALKDSKLFSVILDSGPGAILDVALVIKLRELGQAIPDSVLQQKRQKEQAMQRCVLNAYRSSYGKPDHESETGGSLSAAKP